MKERFVTDPIVARFRVIRERSTLMDGYLRARLALADGYRGAGRARLDSDGCRLSAWTDHFDYWEEVRSATLMLPGSTTTHENGRYATVIYQATRGSA